MNGRLRASTAREFREVDLDGDGNCLRFEATPDWVEGSRAVEQVGSLGIRHRACQRLVQVLGFDEAGANDVFPNIHHGVWGGGKIGRSSNKVSHSSAGRQTAVRKLRSPVHGRKYGCMANTKCIHGLHFSALSQRRVGSVRPRLQLGGHASSRQPTTLQAPAPLGSPLELQGRQRCAS